jgi:chromosome segregation ATPase
MLFRISWIFVFGIAFTSCNEKRKMESEISQKRHELVEAAAKLKDLTTETQSYKLSAPYSYPRQEHLAQLTNEIQYLSAKTEELKQDQVKAQKTTDEIRKQLDDYRQKHF